MADVKDSKIEEVLRQTVRRLAAKDEEVTPSDVRSRTEKKLGLEAGYLSSDVWKKRSKNIIVDAFQKGQEDATQTKQNGTVQSKAAIVGSPSVQPAPKRPEGNPAKINGVKRNASDQSSSPQKKQKTESSSISEESSDEDSSEDESASASSPESDAEPDAGIDEVAEAIPGTQYKPPAGFTAVDPSQSGQNGSMTASASRDKQIWHITAPSSLSLSSLQEFALDAITSREPVLRHSDIEYVMKEDDNPADVDATVFERTRDGYKSTKRKVDRKLQLQPRLVLPNLSAKQASQVTGSSAAADIAAPSVSAVRPQPKGLRMTYRPPGYGPGKLGAVGSGSESTDEDERPSHDNTQPSFQFPKTLGGHGMKKQGSDVNGTADLSPPLPNGVPLSPEAEKATKAKRKEEKRLKRERKEAKRKAREASQ